MTRAARLAVGAAAGAIVAGVAGVAVTLALGLAGFGLGLGLTALRRGSALGSPRPAASLPAVIGLLLIGARLALGGPPPVTARLPVGPGPWAAEVESVGSPRAGSRPAVLHVLGSANGLMVAATLPWYPEVGPGDRISVAGRFEPPGDDAYGDYLRRIGATGTLRATSLALDTDAGAGIGPWEALRRASAVALDRTIPAPEGGLAAGILVGLRDRVDRELAAAFTTAGVSHIVAISGWNIAIVATTLGALTGRLGRRRRTVATGLAIATYVAFVGPSPSVVRAAAMAACALLARDLGRPTTASSAMGLAVTGLLLLDPGYVDDAGFRLSVLATAGLIAWGASLTRWVAGASPSRTRAWLAESLGVSLAAQAATLPVILLDFGRLSIVSPGVNLVVAPVVAPAMAAGALALVVGLASGLAAGVGVLGAVATLAGLPAWLLLGVIIGAVRVAASLPFASVTLDPPLNVAASLLAAGVVAVAYRVVARRRAAAAAGTSARAASPVRSVLRPRPVVVAATARRGGRLVGALLGGAAIAVSLAFVHRPDGATRITILDVGQGDAILIEGGRGGRLLVDGGPDPGRLLIALDERLPPWDRRIDAVVLTHPHEDHVAGLVALLAHERVGRVFESGLRGPGPGYAAWTAELTGDSGDGGRSRDGQGRPSRWALATGDRLEVDDVTLQVLWPDPGSLPTHLANDGSAINDESIVLLGEVDGHRFLLTGDMEREIDPQLIARGLPALDLLKVAHHGSRTASTQAFLDVVRPRVAVVSVGAGNAYGHPAPATMARLAGDAGRVLRTDLDGAVTITFDGGAERVRSTGGRPAGVARPPETVVSAIATATTSRVREPTVPMPVATLPHPPAAAGAGRAGRYHRLDDGPVPGGGGPAAPVAGSAGLARAALARRRGGRGVARTPHRAPAGGDISGGRSPPRRGRRPPP